MKSEEKTITVDVLTVHPGFGHISDIRSFIAKLQKRTDRQTNVGDYLDLSCCIQLILVGGGGGCRVQSALARALGR